MKSTPAKYGMYALVITIIWTIIEHFLGYNTTNHETGQYARMVGAIVFYILIFVAVFAERKSRGGYMLFRHGLNAGRVVSMIYSIGVTVWYCLYGEVINTQYKPTLMAFERAKMESLHASPEAIAAKMKEVDMSTGGSVLSYLILLVMMFVTGMLVSALAALILKRSKKG